jgi:hypothetical protein
MLTLLPFGESIASGEVIDTRAKGPDFWCAFEDGEVKVIGDEPANTD